MALKFDATLTKIKQDLNILRIAQSIYKLRASILVLMSRAKLQDELEMEVKEMYLKMISLGGKVDKKEVKSNMEQFFERDEKATFYEKSTQRLSIMQSLRKDIKKRLSILDQKSDSKSISSQSSVSG